MSAELQKQFERLEDQRAALFSRVEGLDEGALNQPPAEGKWSIIPSELSDRGIFRHPVVGPMSLAQALRFMEDHVGHHAKQIDRIARAARTA